MIWANYTAERAANQVSHGQTSLVRGSYRDDMGSFRPELLGFMPGVLAIADVTMALRPGRL